MIERYNQSLKSGASPRLQLFSILHEAERGVSAIEARKQMFGTERSPPDTINVASVYFKGALRFDIMATAAAEQFSPVVQEDKIMQPVLRQLRGFATRRRAADKPCRQNSQLRLLALHIIDVKFSLDPDCLYLHAGLEVFRLNEFCYASLDGVVRLNVLEMTRPVFCGILHKVVLVHR